MDGLTCGFKEPYLNRLLQSPPLKTREGRRWYLSTGCGSTTWKIWHTLRTRKSYVPVTCFSKDHRDGVTLWYTGYSTYPTDDAAYEDSFKGGIQTWWPLEYDNKASALAKFDRMWQNRTGEYKVVLFHVAQQEPARNGSWCMRGADHAWYEPPEPVQPSSDTEVLRGQLQHPEQPQQQQLPRWQPQPYQPPPPLQLPPPCQPQPQHQPPPPQYDQPPPSQYQPSHYSSAGAQFPQSWPVYQQFAPAVVCSGNAFAFSTPGSYNITMVTSPATAPQHSSGAVLSASKSTLGRKRRREDVQELNAHLTPAHEAAIQRLMNLGSFFRTDVIRALFTANGNEEQARVLLFGSGRGKGRGRGRGSGRGRGRGY